MEQNFAPHLDKAIIHGLKFKFGMDEFYHEHYKVVKGKHKHFPETRPEYKKFKDLFEKTFAIQQSKNDSIKGFIDREKKESEENKEIIGTRNPFYYDLLVEWVEFLKIKEVQFDNIQAEKLKIKSTESKIENPLSHRELALLCYFKEQKMTEGNQNSIASDYNVKNDSGKLFSGHYKKIIDDEKEIYQPKYAKKNLLNIKPYFSDEAVLIRIDRYIAKCNK